MKFFFFLVDLILIFGFLTSNDEIDSSFIIITYTKLNKSDNLQSDEWDDDAFSNMNDAELKLFCDSINQAQIIVYERDTLSKLADYQGTNLKVEKMKLRFHWNEIQTTSFACKFKEKTMVFIVKNLKNENYYLFGKTRNSDTPVLLAIVTQYLKFERHENSSLYFRENMIDLHFSSGKLNKAMKLCDQSEIEILRLCATFIEDLTTVNLPEKYVLEIPSINKNDSKCTNIEFPIRILRKPIKVLGVQCKCSKVSVGDVLFEFTITPYLKFQKNLFTIYKINEQYDLRYYRALQPEK